MWGDWLGGESHIQFIRLLARGAFTIIKLALPRASPHCMSKCLVFPAMWSGLPCAPCTALVNGSSGPPLGAVAPPNGKPEAGYRGSSVYQTFYWDALYAEQA